MNTSGDWPQEAPRWPGAPDPAVAAAAWAVGLDTLARASAVAVIATDERGLRTGLAHAITGPFADWVFVDVLGAGGAWRAVAARHPDPDLAADLLGIRLETCPLIWSAIQRRTPVVCAPIGEAAVLGELPGGAQVTDGLGARSAAVGPIVAAAGVCGAITTVRCGEQPPLGFRELGILSQIGELTGAATDRLRRHGGEPPTGWGRRTAHHPGQADR
jgi:GAF domain-containing protein